jgi:hypothetical protein
LQQIIEDRKRGSSARARDAPSFPAKQITAWTLHDHGTARNAQKPASPHRLDNSLHETWAEKQDADALGSKAQYSILIQAKNSTLDCSKHWCQTKNVQDKKAAQSVSLLARSLPLASTIRIQAGISPGMTAAVEPAAPADLPHPG